MHMKRSKMDAILQKNACVDGKLGAHAMNRYQIR